MVDGQWTTPKGGSGMPEASTPVEIFCCYAQEDRLWPRKLEGHLGLFKRQGLISLCHDRLIALGTDWVRAIDTHLENASVILLLVSADFLLSFDRLLRDMRKVDHEEDLSQ